eukprot:8419235-Alexandrium_andersonii.AAC.1
MQGFKRPQGRVWGAFRAPSGGTLRCCWGAARRFWAPLGAVGAQEHRAAPKSASKCRLKAPAPKS